MWLIISNGVSKVEQNEDREWITGFHQMEADGLDKESSSGGMEESLIRKNQIDNGDQLSGNSEYRNFFQECDAMDRNEAVKVK